MLVVDPCSAKRQVDRCTKGQRECCYDEELSENGTYRFKSENNFATGSRKRRPREKRLLSPEIPSDHASPVAHAASSPGSASQHEDATFDSRVEEVVGKTELEDTLDHTSVPLRRLQLPLEAHALAHFAVNYTESPPSFPEIIDGHARHILPIFLPSAADSPLRYTIAAVSLASFGINEGRAEALPKAQRAYQAALVRTKLALTDRHSLTSDELLVTVMCLSHYGGMTQTSDDLLLTYHHGPGYGYRQARSWSHHAGAVIILRMRHSMEQSPEQRALDRTVRRGLLKTFLLREEPIPSWMSDGAAFGETGLGLAIDEATVRVSHLRQQASKVLRTAPISLQQNISQLLALVREAHVVDAMLTSVVADLPSEWAYTIVATNPSTNAYYGSRAYLYTSLGHAAIWNRYRALRLLVNDTLVRAYQLQAMSAVPVAPMSLEAAQAKIQGLLKEICASVPQYFNDVVGPLADEQVVDSLARSDCHSNALSMNLLTFSLLVALSVSSISVGQKLWLKERLAEVGKRANRSVLRAVASSV